jgi:hypothetical protein
MNPPEESSILDARDYLEDVRDQSCYGTLRQLLTLWFGLLYVICGSWMIFSIVTLFSVDALFGAANLGLSILGMVFITAWRQASLLLIDVADVIIDMGRHWTD